MDYSHLLDDIRRQIQKSLLRSKHDQLLEAHDIPFDHIDSSASPETEDDFVDSLAEFDRQFEAGLTTTARERIGNPPLPPAEEIPPDALEKVLDDLLDLLAEHGIVIDFLGDWDDLAAYRHITEQMLDEERDDIRVEGTFVHFEAATVEYDVEMWVDEFIRHLFWQDRQFFHLHYNEQPLLDQTGRQVPLSVLAQIMEALGRHLPLGTHPHIEARATEVTDNEAAVSAVVSWRVMGERKEIPSFFRLQPSLYYGWDVTQTSLLGDLLSAISWKN